MQTKKYSLDLGNGKIIEAEFNDLANQATGSVIIRSEKTVVLVTAVMSEKENLNAGYFPLRVDYEERFYASGKILGNRYTRREGKPTEQAILNGRIVDRTIRPLFNQLIRNDIQLIATVLSIGDANPDHLSVIGASLALGTSHIPFNGPVSAVRIVLKEGSDDFLINPPFKTKNEERIVFDSIICGKDNMVNMIEVGSHEVDEEVMNRAVSKSLQQIEIIQEFQNKIIHEIGKPKKADVAISYEDSLKNLFEDNIESKLESSIFGGPGKEKIDLLKMEWMNTVKKELEGYSEMLADNYFEEKVNSILHREAIENNRRADGRKMDEVREIFVQAGGMSELLHGSGTFYRGGTHVFSTITLGGPEDSQTLEGDTDSGSGKRFFHHYNFPPFSTGEVGSIGNASRRSIGHGALAEKALESVIPHKDVFPYTIRAVSEAFASNGSTSMGSVCASTLALMDAGVPIKNTVAGIAMGLMMESIEKYKVLTDIQGPEDHHGDMDLKVAGTKQGITAVQMDIKIGGITKEILREAFLKAKEARLFLINKIESEISAPRDHLSPHAPHIMIIKINPEKIGLVIGSGGKTINAIKEKTSADITIEDDGSVYITGSENATKETAEIILSMTKEYKIGEELKGMVTKIAEFGLFVSLDKNTEGLVHISEVAPFRINNLSEIIKRGDVVPVKVIKVDAEQGKIGLSIKAIAPDFFKLEGNGGRS